MHWSSIWEEWSNMIGYEMGSSPAGVYTMAKTWRTSRMDENMTWLSTWHDVLLGGLLQRSSMSGNLKPLDKKLGLCKTPTRDFYVLFVLFFPSSPPYQVLPQIALSWGNFFGPIGALLHCSLNGTLKPAFNCYLGCAELPSLNGSILLDLALTFIYLRTRYRGTGSHSRWCTT